MDIRGGLVVLFLFVLMSGFVVGQEYVQALITESPQSNMGSFNVQSLNAESNIDIIRQIDQETSMAKISRREFDRLRSAGTDIKEANRVQVFMQDVVGIVNSSIVNNLQINSLNLTGISQSVCVLDTGVNSSHPDLLGRVVAEKCYCNTIADGACCPGGLSVSDNATDGHGHGTHVSGIIAASDNLLGIAPGISIVSVKVISDTNNGNEGDLINGVQWCIDNADLYNISVISASLGADCDLNPELCSAITCDSNSSGLTTRINEAMSKNISITISTGNDYSSDVISWPSCHTSITRVSSVDKGDLIASYANRNSLVRLLGVGSSVNSTSWLGGYEINSGTSMATPVVAGAIAIINQYLNLTGRTMIPEEIESSLFDTGKRIVEGVNNFSRINVYSALLSLDETAPNITLTSPVNETQSTDVNQTFVCNFTDWQLKNSTFYLYNSTDLINQTEFNITGTENSTSLQINNLSEGDYSWACSGYDDKSNYALSDNNTLSIADIFVTINVPVNETYTIQNDTNFNCSAEASSGLSNMTFYLYNSTDLINQTIVNVTGTQNSSLFNYVLPTEDVYSWNCEASNVYSAQSSNYTITYDITSPLIENLSESPSHSSAMITFDAGEAVNYSLNYSVGNVNGSEYSSSPSISLSGLAATTTYNYNLTACDKAGNCNVTNSSFVTTSAPSPNGGSRRSPSGGGSPVLGSEESPVEYEGVVDGGYSAVYFAGQSKYFKDGLNNTHNVTLDNVIQDIAVITIQSERVTVYLLENQSYKLNLTSKDYYDMQIAVGEVSGLSANITILAINEPIPEPIRYYTTEEVPEEKVGVGHNIPLIISLVFIILLLSFALSKLLKRKRANKNHGKK